MPCYDERDSPSFIHESYKKRDDEQREKINKLTRMLCTLCGTLERGGWSVLITDTPELQGWWIKHQKQDKLHEAAEKALTKLK
jgi:hypothetical protein